MPDRKSAKALFAPSVQRRVNGGPPRVPVDVAGVVLAGVHPWGGCPLERVTSRPLVPVAGRPLIWQPLNWLRGGGIRKAIIWANGDTRALREALGDDAGLKIALDYGEDTMPRGPAGCARDAALTSGAQLFVVVDGTIIPQIDLGALLDAHMKSEAVLTVVAASAGSAKQRADTLPEPVGVYVFDRAALEQVSDTGYQDIKETLIPRLHRQGWRVEAYVVQDASLPRVTGVESYLAVSMWAVQGITEQSQLSNGYWRLGDAWVHESARVAESARLVGSVLVGAGCVIDSGAMIIGPTTIGSSCSIERSSIMSRSVVWDRCRVGAGAIVDKCILTDEAEVEPELVVRSTVCLTPRAARWTFLRRLVSRWGAGNGKASIASSPAPDVTARRDIGSS